MTSQESWYLLLCAAVKLLPIYVFTWLYLTCWNRGRGNATHMPLSLGLPAVTGYLGIEMLINVSMPFKLRRISEPYNFQISFVAHHLGYNKTNIKAKRTGK